METGMNIEIGFHAPIPVSARESCPRCLMLEERLAQLEKRLAERGAPTPVPGHGAAPTFPFILQAVRIAAGGWAEGWSLTPAPNRRPWMDESPYAYQCLPLVVGNQWGWQIGCPCDVRVTWDGSPSPLGLSVEVAPPYDSAIQSRFGQGILTFSPPWLFRSPPGWDLYCKGPSNTWKANAAALEGVIETWWLPYTFTLNWKLMAAGTAEFHCGEWLAQLFPVPHGTFQGASAVEMRLDDVPDVKTAYAHWIDERRRREDQAGSRHHLYRKAELVPGHLVHTSVPPMVRLNRQVSRPGSSLPPDQ
jgi:hypothetical protein